MLFKEVKLKKNGWHKKLQKKTFGWEYDYELPFRNNFCPYFWLTIFCVLISPFTAVRLCLKFATCSLLDGFAYMVEKFDKYICDPITLALIGKMSDEDVYQSYQVYLKRGAYRAESQKWLEWKKLNPKEWEQKLQELKDLARVREAALHLKNIEAEKKAYKTQKKRQAFFNRIIKYTKFVAPSVIFAAGVGALYGLYRLVLQLISWSEAWNFVAIWGVVLVILMVIAFIIAFIFSAYCIGLILGKCSRNFSPFKKIKKALGCFFGFIFKPVVSVFSFIWEFILAYKENNCPPIIWED